MNIERQSFEEIAAWIHSDDSPVGIDAKRTHVYIIHLLRNIERRLDDLERRLER